MKLPITFAALNVWRNLISVVEEHGMQKEAEKFRRAKDEEDEHLDIVRNALKELTRTKLSA